MPRTPPHHYASKVRKPAGLDSFWDGVLEQAAAIPLSAKTAPARLRSPADIETFEVHFNSLDGVRIAGWYCLPRERSKKLPAILTVPGYLGEPPIPLDWARKGYAVLSVAPRGKLRSNDQFNPGYPGLLTHNITDRNTYGYKGFYVDAMRGLDYLLTRDEVDVKRIGVVGSSQGGGLAIVAAAMRPEIAAASAGAPYLCGFMDAIGLTSTYPYQEINDYLRLHPDSRKEVEETLAYFDGMSFAERITCPIVVNIGLQDNICPPETGYEVFNKIASEEKRLYTYDGHAHDAGSHEHSQIIDAFFSRHLNP